MNFWRSAAGMLELELTSAEMEAALTAINEQGIVLYGMEGTGALSCCFRISRWDYKTISAICQKRGETLRILRQSGLYWTGKRLLMRPWILVGMTFLLFLAMYLPTRVLFVQVEGNKDIPQGKILAAAEDCGITFGASRREVRSEKMKNTLLSALPELQWAGVNTYGCVAVISVREGTEKERTEQNKMVTSIIASRDGYILSGTAVRGNALFTVGQTVKQGQILISGYTDCGLCIQATRAAGEVVAQTHRELEAVTPSECCYRGSIQEIKRRYSLLFRKKRINLWKDSGISDTTCGRIYEEYYITLPGGFQLPLALCVESYFIYDIKMDEILTENAQAALSEFSQQYLKQQMIAGTILRKQETVSSQNGIHQLRGSYTCTEMIGREQQEQIGEANGKSD